MELLGKAVRSMVWPAASTVVLETEMAFTSMSLSFHSPWGMAPCGPCGKALCPSDIRNLVDLEADCNTFFRRGPTFFKTKGEARARPTASVHGMKMGGFRRNVANNGFSYRSIDRLSPRRRPLPRADPSPKGRAGRFFPLSTFFLFISNFFFLIETRKE